MSKKRVLFIGIGFYDYEEAIIQEFKKLDYDVDYLSEVPPNTIQYRLNTRFGKTRKLEAQRAAYSLEISNKSATDYDLIFIIKCEYLTEEALHIIKNKNLKAKFVLYLWDSLKRFKTIENKFRFFDKVYSFDRFDCQQHKELIFHPLFFRNEYANRSEVIKTDYDLYHLGWYHSDRLNLIKKLVNAIEPYGMRYKMVLFTGYLSYLLDSIIGGDLKGNRKFFVFKPVSAKDNFETLIRSKVILDIAHPDQSGLTMRTIEMVGAQKKIITTNKDIVNYDFYHPNNVMVIDRENPVLDLNFFKVDYFFISEKIASKYSIKNWLKRMLEE
ncbi:hypothetical protein [Flavobacterium sp. WC2509]|uniref:hypothetical protein n=1 Tax=Flavobacterium sp. WC2509 TaxID=3461406 RepID=UPI0040440133